MPQATYIMPASRSQFINQAIDSMLNQSMQDIEILISPLNDCFNGHVDKRVINIKRDNANPISTTNALINTASSDIIMFLGDDDFDLPHKAQVAYDALQHCDIFTGSYNKVNEKGIKIGEYIAQPYDFDKHIYHGLNMHIGVGGFRKSKCPTWNENLPYFADYAFWLESYRLGLTMHVTNEIISNIRCWDGQDSNKIGLYPEIRSRERKIFKDTYGVDVNR